MTETDDSAARDILYGIGLVIRSGVALEDMMRRLYVSLIGSSPMLLAASRGMGFAEAYHSCLRMVHEIGDQNRAADVRAALNQADAAWDRRNDVAHGNQSVHVASKNSQPRFFVRTNHDVAHDGRPAELAGLEAISAEIMVAYELLERQARWFRDQRA
jgi:hypothetical protein